MPSAFAQESEPLPDAEELRAANDSILAEAYLLYLFEKSAWVLEDVLAASKPATMNEMGGWFPVGDEENEDVIKGVFFNKEKAKAFDVTPKSWTV